MSRRILAVVGIVMMALGLLWAAQGTGLFPYPAASFMIDQRPWLWIGLAVALAGLAVLLASRRR